MNEWYPQAFVIIREDATLVTKEEPNLRTEWLASKKLLINQRIIACLWGACDYTIQPVREISQEKKNIFIYPGRAQSPTATTG